MIFFLDAEEGRWVFGLAGGLGMIYRDRDVAHAAGGVGGGGGEGSRGGGGGGEVSRRGAAAGCFLYPSDAVDQ